MPCYCEIPTESEIIYDRIMMKLLNSNDEVRKTVFEDIKELVNAYVKIHAERNRMGNILCDLAQSVKHNASCDIWPSADFFCWIEEHEKRDKEKDLKDKSNSLLYMDELYIKMGE